jgi:hypothetical protein
VQRFRPIGRGIRRAQIQCDDLVNVMLHLLLQTSRLIEAVEDFLILISKVGAAEVGLETPLLIS